jgi:undecaprenyl pyrophosphate phosphatase UppP
MGKAERDLVAQPNLSSRSAKKRRKKHPEYDRFTWYSLVVVGAIFILALNLYLSDMHATLGVHILSVMAPMILLALYFVLSRFKRRYTRGKRSNHIPVKNTLD